MQYHIFKTFFDYEILLILGTNIEKKVNFPTLHHPKNFLFICRTLSQFLFFVRFVLRYLIRNVFSAELPPDFKGEMKDVTVAKEQSATFQVELTKGDARARWFKDSKSFPLTFNTPITIYIFFHITDV